MASHMSGRLHVMLNLVGNAEGRFSREENKFAVIKRNYSCIWNNYILPDVERISDFITFDMRMH